MFCESDQRIESNFCSPREKISFISKSLLSNKTSALWGPSVVIFLFRSVLFEPLRSSNRPNLLSKPGLR